MLRSRFGWLILPVLALALLGAVIISVDAGQPGPVTLSGVVVGADGRPVADARVRGPEGHRTRTDGDGRFQLTAGPGLITVRAAGWLPRTRAGAPGDPVVIRLAERTPGTVTLAFGGDVMFGRRFFDPTQSGSVDGLLPLDASAEDHEQLVAGVARLFRHADLAAVNLETPLLRSPYLDPTEPRPDHFHPTKDLVFGTSLQAASALSELGIDVVDVGNNHLYDAMEQGVRETGQALRSAGYLPGEGYFGAGTTPKSAWAPAIRTVRGTDVAYLGCTTVTGDRYSTGYVADPTQGGAAACAAGRLRRAVTAARDRADVVVVMIHGGVEYDRDPAPEVRHLSDVAERAGAALVVNHHPHVVGGLRFEDGSLTAWTMGNLVFDQIVWPTFESYVLEVAVRGGRVVSAWVEPFRIQEFQPTAVTGDDADWVASGTWARSTGPWIPEDGSLWLDTSGGAEVASREVSDGLVRIDGGCARDAGRELLWTGDFEVGDVDGAQAPLWNVTTGQPFRQLDPDAAHSGTTGVLLHRTFGDTEDATLTVTHRALVDAGDRLTFLVSFRATRGDPRTEVRLGWYDALGGGSQAVSVAPIDVSEGWHTTRIDVRVPDGAVAVQPYIALRPVNGQASELAVDDVALVDWDEPGCDYAEGPATVTAQALPPYDAEPAVTPVEAEPVDVRAPLSLETDAGIDR